MSRFVSLCASAVLLCAGVPLLSQDISSNVSAQVISAKPGMVNYVEGGPLVFRRDQEEGTKLVARNQLKPGERLQTKESDRAEILLSPGSYLRVAGSSQVEVVKAEFDDMHFNLLQGIAILESAAFDKKVHALKISTPAGDVRVVDNGLYRFQVTPDRRVEVFVYSGKAEWLKDQHEIAILKSKKRYLLGTDEKGKPQFVKLDKDAMDSVDLWSKRRAEYLVAANDRVSDWMFDSGYYGYGYNRYRGGWVFSPFFNAFTFVPFGDYAYYSPYGYYYGSYYPYYGYGYGHGGGGSGGSTSSGSGSSGGTTKPRNSTVQQRSASSSSSSAPSSRVSYGRSDQGNRGSVRTAPSPSSRQK
jgi:FecR protein